MSIKDSVRKNYAQAITGIGKGSESCSCCGPVRLPDGYNADDALGLAVGASFGCGNPTALAALYAGETVLDLGCGAGLDLILSARRVGPTGMVFGLDMTEEMLAVAERNIDQSGLKNIRLLQGDIEKMPLPDNAVDVIISNCVINLSPDKARVLREAFRVLKPGGRFAVFDIVLEQPLPGRLQGDAALWSACISGALLKEEYLRLLGEAGFEEASIETQNYSCGDQELSKLGSLAAGIKSGFVRAKKPAQPFLAQAGAGLRPAVSGDLPRISTLLEANALPLDGVEEHLKNFWVAEAPDGNLAGVIGLEAHGEIGVPRSLAVAPSFRKQGLATVLLATAETTAREQGIRWLGAVTVTAAGFAERFGYRPATDEEKAAILNCTVLAGVCPTSAQVVAKHL